MSMGVLRTLYSALTLILEASNVTISADVLCAFRYSTFMKVIKVIKSTDVLRA